MKRVIVVLGMHRSGTSAITRGLQVLGADLGPELMPGVVGDNDKGFWEDLGCFRINERVLEKLGSSWDALAEISAEDLQSETLAEERRDAVALLRERLEGVDVFAFKDPRTVNLLPFWQDVFRELNLDDRYLIALRNPRSVADSLARRNGFAREKSFCLWMKHTCNSLIHGTDKPAVVVDYDLFLGAPGRELARMAQVLGFNPPDQNSEEYRGFVEEFLSTDLRHSQYREAVAEEDVVPPFVGRLYDLLLGAAGADTGNSVFKVSRDEWAPLCQEFADYAPVMSYIDSMDEAAGELRTQLRHTNEQLEGTCTRLAAIRSEHTKLESEHAKLESELEQSSETMESFYSRLSVFNRSILGRLFTILEIIYRLLRLKPNAKTCYRQLVEESEIHFTQDQLSASEYIDAPTGRLRLVGSIVKYVIRHPYSSIRLVSVYRLKKLFQTVFLADSGTARNWVSSRFPAEHRARRLPVIFPVSEVADDTVLEFPTFETAKVSIVVPVYNQYRTTISCLQSVLANTEGVSYEVIVADDCSTDITSSIETRIGNIKVVRGEQNLGFLKNCNHAAAQAKGEYVVLLNNDTNVQKGWLTALVQAMESQPDVGMVGPKLLFEDGVLQEAGGIVWKDGSGWNYGRGQNPDLPEFNYLRETDYISGACILFAKSVWDELGGFDERFCPAYYEDTDLAFQMRQRGLKVVYQPESVVVHFEGVSNGTDVGSGIKKHQAINQQVFRDKWEHVLETEHFPNAENVFQARERSSGKKTVVFVDHYVPFYDKDAGSRSTFLYVKSMIEAGLNVKFVPANFFPHQPYTRELQQMGVEVLVGEKYARTWKTWFTDNSHNIDVIYLHRPHITEDFIDHLTTLNPRPKLIYFGHDLHYLRTNREAELLGKDSVLADADDWKRRELEIFQKVDKVYYPSEVEVAEVLRVAPGTDASAIPLYLLNKPDIRQFRHAERDGLLFVGGFGHPPNADAVVWFATEVLPSLQREIPDICLHIVGSSVPDNIQNLASGCVRVHGFLSDEDLAALYQKVKICVVPLRYGAGVKGKILEALQAGLPISTTSIGAEGLPEAARVMAIADQPSEMVSQILGLYNDPDECGKYLASYADYIEQHFSQSQVQRVIDRDFLN
ncbi:MAG: glycosyltransferase [Marinobacter sp.]|nr:glycosyltransferase [Marinobacter sp.]